MRLLNIYTNKVQHFDGPDSAPPYAALSYVWPQHIEEATLWSKALLPTASGRLVPFVSEWPIPSCTPWSLAEALRAIYVDGACVLDDRDGAAPDEAAPDEASPRPTFTHLWMDVICVNQVDAADKATEVGRMKDYYSQAVCTWVFMEHLGMRGTPIKGGGRPARWFSRLWTLQECILPSKLFFYLESSAGCKAGAPTGSAWVSRKHMIAYVATSALEDAKTPEEVRYRYAIQLMPLSITKPSIRTSVFLAAFRECRFEVDRFYGIAGMLPSDHNIFDWSKFTIDFAKDFNQVKHDFVAALGSQVILSFASMSPSHGKDGESKLPDNATSSWFASFLPGMYHSASIDQNCEVEEMVSFLTDNTYDRKQFWKDKHKRVSTSRFSDVLLKASATSDSGRILIQDAPVIPLASLSAIERQFTSNDDGVFYYVLLDLRSSVNRKLGGWAQKQSNAYLEFIHSGTRYNRLALKLANSFFNALSGLGAGDLAGSQFCYPPLLWSVRATTRGGVGITGMGGRYSPSGKLDSGEPHELALVYVGQSVTTFGNGSVATHTQMADDFAVCEVVEGSVPAGGTAATPAGEVNGAQDATRCRIVVRKLGVLHVRSYHRHHNHRSSSSSSSISISSSSSNGSKNRTKDAPTPKPMPANDFDDFVVADVLFT
ncbi:hypothetical protein HK405_009492 [Cladochytrium tenue]|nr:hypothetical protein HK405_009492 [Cladochytrium tenue]